MSNKELTEIVASDKSVERIINRAIELDAQSLGVTRETVYEIASEIDVSEKSVEKAIEESKLSDYDFVKFAHLLNLKDRNELIGDKRVRVVKSLFKILKRAKRFRPIVFTLDEIDALYRERGIEVNPLIWINSKYFQDSVNHHFVKVYDNQYNVRYKLEKFVHFWD